VTAEADATGKTPLSTEDRLWYPDLPPSTVGLLGSYTPSRQGIKAWLPSSYVLFGNSDGSLLPHLDRIRIWSINASDVDGNFEPATIYGLQFLYSGSQSEHGSRLLGALPAPSCAGRQRHDLTVESREGERINAVDVLRMGNRQILSFKVGLSLHTLNLTYYKS
jgi:hypothetical protein